MRQSIWTAVGITVAIVAALAGAQRRQVEAPQPLLASAANAVAAETCAECHDDVYSQFQGSAHQLTLRRPDDDALWKYFAGKRVETLLGNFEFERRQGKLWFSGDRHPDSVAVDWVFGSGLDSLTPVTVAANHRGQLELNQLHVSWFPGTGLGLTFGSESVAANPASLGIHHDQHQTRECFACHATYLPQADGTVDLQRMLPGVTCSRCHPGGQEHASSDGAIATQTPWHALTPLESIQRCGECHRRADQMTADELDIQRAERLARFAPVGLVQSRCFTEQLTDPHGKPLRMDCMTCHDPHTPAETDPAHYRQQCNTCHGNQPHQAAACATNPMTSNCLPCHMPKVPIGDHLQVTDHWIRSPQGQ